MCTGYCIARPCPLPDPAQFSYEEVIFWYYNFRQKYTHQGTQLQFLLRNNQVEQIWIICKFEWKKKPFALHAWDKWEAWMGSVFSHFHSSVCVLFPCAVEGNGLFLLSFFFTPNIFLFSFFNARNWQPSSLNSQVVHALACASHRTSVEIFWFCLNCAKTAADSVWMNGQVRVGTRAAVLQFLFYIVTF